MAGKQNSKKSKREILIVLGIVAVVALVAFFIQTQTFEGSLFEKYSFVVPDNWNEIEPLVTNSIWFGSNNVTGNYESVAIIMAMKSTSVTDEWKTCAPTQTTYNDSISGAVYEVVNASLRQIGEQEWCNLALKSTAQDIEMDSLTTVCNTDELVTMAFVTNKTYSEQFKNEQQQFLASFKCHK